MARVLIIEDDTAAAEEIALALTAHGLHVERAANGLEGLTRAREGGYDAITLDRMLPGLGGLAVVVELRAAGVDTPVLMISALGDVDERITGLRAGGDDYLTKPFSPDEMVARVEVLLRRHAREDGADARVDATRLTVGDLELDLLSRTVRRSNRDIDLLPTEYKLLEFMVRNAGQALTRQIIFEKVWEYFFDPGANLINVHIARLRKKLEAAGEPPMITTVRGAGYRLDARP